ncbi:uncharacterized protein FIBRA_07529 [Fibroporia radiculosa]|uniref:Uncharacterized protein n=1 Tax=Fibroporia radiculosa TaxID=599839 RepID=J4GV56_9APHY|nr:uncharacterized protein FIBRA_07529 [Fibroporia radiculosa]CCM05315.1 predicted protein [Fibroporia radiculosa]
MSNAGDSTGGSLGRSLGNKLKGAWNVVEGAGDSLRGGAMDFIDAATGTDGHHAETDIGIQKTHAGMAEIRGNTSAPVETTLPRATATTSAAPPLPARSGIPTSSTEADTSPKPPPRGSAKGDVATGTAGSSIPP